MERKRLLAVIHLHIPMVLADSLADALYPKAMPMLIGLMGGQAALVLALETITILAYSLVIKTQYFNYTICEEMILWH